VIKFGPVNFAALAGLFALSIMTRFAFNASVKPTLQAVDRSLTEVEKGDSGWNERQDLDCFA
jgi:hypothetical protein